MSRKKTQKNTILNYIENKEQTNVSINSFIEKKIAAQAQKIQDQKEETEEVRKLNELQIELKEQKKRNDTLQKDSKRAVALLKEAGAVNLNKDFHISELNKKLQSVEFETKQTGDAQLFDTFAHYFSQQQLKKLRSITSGQTKDSTLVLTCMKFLYPNKNVLRNKSVDGNKYKGQKKDQLTPLKVKIISNMLSERLSNEKGLDSFSASMRFNRVKVLIKNAINKLKNQTIKSKKPNLVEHTSNEFDSCANQRADSYNFQSGSEYANQSANHLNVPYNPYTFQRESQYAFSFGNPHTFQPAFLPLSSKRI